LAASVAREECSHDGMFELARLVYHLDLRIAEAILIIDVAAQPQRADVDILIDREADHCAAMPFEIGGIIGPASEETDTQRGSGGDDHDRAADRVCVAGEPDGKVARHCAMKAST